MTEGASETHSDASTADEGMAGSWGQEGSGNINNMGECPEFAAEFACTDLARDWNVSVCAGIHYVGVQVVVDGASVRFVSRLFEVLSQDDKHRLDRFRTEWGSTTNAGNRASVMNRLIAQRQYRSYLEIGTELGHNFLRILCEHKESNDIVRTFENLTHHMSSDSLFEKFRKENKECFDLIFIDGLHEAPQVARDIANGDIFFLFHSFWLLCARVSQADNVLYVQGWIICAQEACCFCTTAILLQSSIKIARVREENRIILASITLPQCLHATVRLATG